MELFEEVKNRYMHIVFKVLNECEKGLSEKDIITIVGEEEFEEKVIGNNFQTFEGLLLNKYSDSENFNLLKEKEGNYYPNINEDKRPPVPVRLTNLEKAWLKNMLEDKRVEILLSASTIEKLKAAMERCFMSFSELERYSRCIEKDKYELKLFYYTFEEDDIIRKILTLGPYVKIISPESIK